MTKNTKTIVSVAAGMAVMGVLLAVVLRGVTEPAGDATTAAAPAEEAPAAEPPPIPNPRVLLEASAVSTADETLATQVRAIVQDRQAVFRATLSDEALAKLTPEAWATCKKRVREQPLSPTWDAAVATDGGAQLRTATVFGSAKATFRGDRGRWIGETIWCAAP